MNPMKRLLSFALTPSLFLVAAAGASAQESPPPSPPAPVPAASPTVLDRAYDGRLHVTLAPYLWLPTVRTNTQYTIPQLPTGAGGKTFVKNAQVGPSDYLTNLNSAAQFAFNVRFGEAELLGDYIYTNASSTANFNTAFSGPLGKLRIPASFTTNARLAASIWELAAGFTLAHGHSADANMFVGWRQFPLTTNLAWTATIGSKLVLTRSGTVRIAPLANDVIFGLNGRIFAADHWYLPYYIDYGYGATQQTWEGYGGAGYVFNHGQTLVALFRTLNYSGFATSSPVQKLSMWGPLFGYTFQM